MEARIEGRSRISLSSGVVVLMLLLRGTNELRGKRDEVRIAVLEDIWMGRSSGT